MLIKTTMHVNSKQYGQSRNARPFTFFAIVLLASVPLYGLNYLPIPTPLGLPPSYVSILIPMIVAMCLAYQEGGSQRMWGLFSLRWQRAGRTVPWVATSLLTMPLLMGAMYGAMVLTGDTALEQASLTLLAAVLICVQYFVGAIPEEIGWTSYATGPLQRKYGVLVAGLVLGCVWELWHIIPFVQMGHSGWWIAAHVCASIGVRVMMGYIYKGTHGALVAAIVVHALFNFIPAVLPGGYADYRPEYFLPFVAVGMVVMSRIRR